MDGICMDDFPFPRFTVTIAIFRNLNLVCRGWCTGAPESPKNIYNHGRLVIKNDLHMGFTHLRYCWISSTVVLLMAAPSALLQALWVFFPSQDAIEGNEGLGWRSPVA